MKKILAMLVLFTPGLKGEIEFSGFFTAPREAYFSLTDTDGSRTSGWLKIGQSFAGYTVLAFDEKREVITLRQDGRLVNLPLRAAKIKSARAIIQGTLTLLNEQVSGVRVSLFIGEETTFPVRNGISFRLKPEQLPDGNLLFRAKFVSVEKDGAERILATPAVVAMPGKAFGIKLGDFGFDFEPATTP